MSNKVQFSDYLLRGNKKGSGKASSYIRAIDLVSKMILANPLGFEDCVKIWNVTSIARLEDLYQYLTIQSKLGEKGEWGIDGIPISYLRDGFCSAAIRSYQEFILEYSYEQTLIEKFSSYQGAEEQLNEVMLADFNYPDFLIEDKVKEAGVDVERTVKTRLNQNVFRKMVLGVYKNTCCISGLDIPQVNRASHIIPWSENRDARLDPRNGLCLSATYDAAFDRNLISLDEDYRMIVSKDIKDHYSSESASKYFLSKEGEKISLPSSYRPKVEYLEQHRNKGRF